MLAACAANGALAKYTADRHQVEDQAGAEEKARNDSLPRLATVHAHSQGEGVSCQAP